MAGQDPVLRQLEFHGLPDELDRVVLRRIGREETESYVQLLSACRDFFRLMNPAIVRDHHDPLVSVGFTYLLKEDAERFRIPFLGHEDHRFAIQRIEPHGVDADHFGGIRLDDLLVLAPYPTTVQIGTLGGFIVESDNHVVSGITQCQSEVFFKTPAGSSGLRRSILNPLR